MLSSSRSGEEAQKLKLKLDRLPSAEDDNTFVFKPTTGWTQFWEPSRLPPTAGHNVHPCATDKPLAKRYNSLPYKRVLY
ncbi:MAG: hypothetical protein K0R48_298 [Gammaproteobacteria bacterium]|nr:hypothetical protein [Gammaproteobacteria bacterium]